MNGEVPESALSTVMLLITGGRRLQERLDERLASLGLSLRLLGALGHVARDSELSYSDLARRAGVTSQSMRATVLLLEELGAVRRTLPGQGHRARLELTDHGSSLLSDARTVAAELDAEVLAGLTAESRRALNHALLHALGPVGAGSSRTAPGPRG
ncbi:MarR family winged helix-turn-helix transcriptional regulator [Streptomyces sp. NP-1717]|uniref:MarR family winged helix-turn-helix transcriptional regulator n=1 Tax=Streptomyces sp. NP-1717 TaxID=2704470 RepID=UPI001F5C69D4|nr:MarR family transcriptional regulator [Streptomyces sp. NP-1717]MCI3220849.1 MarR family transcriptional regulator [Streptomyces sp. NP-1717]